MQEPTLTERLGNVEIANACFGQRPKETAESCDYSVYRIQDVVGRDKGLPKQRLQQSKSHYDGNTDEQNPVDRDIPLDWNTMNREKEWHQPLKKIRE